MKSPNDHALVDSQAALVEDPANVPSAYWDPSPCPKLLDVGPKWPVILPGAPWWEFET